MNQQGVEKKLLPVYECCLRRLQGSQGHGQQHLHPHEVIQEASALIQYSCDLHIDWKLEISMTT